MAKPEWGVKRTCQSCGVRFYDLRRSPIACPACKAVFTPDLPARQRRAAPMPQAAPAPVAVDLGPEVPEEVEDEEDEHLYHSAGWSRELWIDSLGLPAVLPPPEEEKEVKTAIGAARAKAARKEML